MTFPSLFFAHDLVTRFFMRDYLAPLSREYLAPLYLAPWASPSLAKSTLTWPRLAGIGEGRQPLHHNLGVARGTIHFVADIAAMKLGIAFLVLAGACCGLGGQPAAAQKAASVAAAIPQPVPLPRPRPVIGKPAWPEPHTFREAAGIDFKSEDVTSAPSDCRLRLEKIAILTPMPRLIGPGSCGGGDMVELSAVRLSTTLQVMVKPAPVIRCAMAESLSLWIRDEAVPRVAKTGGAALRIVDTYDDFNCRGRNRVIGARMSEHGRGNAVDIRSFTLADSKVMFLTDMHAPKDLRIGLRESVCGRFTTVLGPGSDGYHEEHIHLDMAERNNSYRICQWDVREPPPPPPPKEEEASVAAELADKPTPNPLTPKVGGQGAARRKL
jgi:hypothetical protein